MIDGTWAVARHELRLAWRDRAVLALGAVLTLLLVVATAVSTARHNTEAAQRARYQQLVGEQFQSQPDRHPHRVSHYGYLLFRPRAPLGAFDSGVERFAGTSVFLEAHRQNSANFSDASQGGSGERFGELTPALVLQLFVPLFILVVAGTSVTREREAGTLALLLSQGTPWGTVLRGKLLGSALVAAVVLVPGGAAALTWGALGAGGPAVDVPNTTMTVRVLLLAGLHLVFWAVCAALGVLVSARHATSRGALATTLGLWISLWIIVPRLVPAAAAALHPIPARVQFDAQVEARLRELGDSHDPDDPVFARLRDETLTRYGVSRVEDLPFNYAGLVMREGERHTSEAFQQHIGAVQASFDRQARVVEWTGIVSPYLAVRSLSMALAGADLAHVAAFERQAESYRYALIQALNDLHMHEVDASRDRYETVASGAPSRQRIDRAFFERLPTFRFTAPPLDDVLRARLVAVLALVAFVMLALIAFGATIRRGGAHPVR